MHPDDLNDLEARLSAWKPATEGLDTDAMLFAAGRASVPRPWPLLVSVLVLVAVALGAWAGVERSGRLALVAKLQQPTPAPGAPTAPAGAPSLDAPGANSLLTAHRALQHGLDAWPPREITAPTPDAPSSPTLQVGHREALLAP